MKFLIVGGDKRIKKLAEMLKKERHDVKTYGIENADIKNIEKIINQKTDVVIGPIPFTKDEETLNAPFIKEKIYIDALLPFLKKQTLITGPISKELQEKFERYTVKAIDIMDSEELVVYNTIATAEGTIELAIANTEKNLHESKILILGFGRVAKTLALKLKGLAQHIMCAARKSKDFALIETLGFSTENINKLGPNLNEYDIIINTVPQVILNEEKINYIKDETLIIDLASKPGGVDQLAIKKTNIKYIWALALPGKVSPISSAQYIKQAIYKIIDIFLTISPKSSKKLGKRLFRIFIVCGTD